MYRIETLKKEGHGFLLPWPGMVPLSMQLSVLLKSNNNNLEPNLLSWFRVNNLWSIFLLD